MFTYACPFCDQRLLAPPERVGQRTICPKCLRPLTIPSPEQAGAEDVDTTGPGGDEPGDTSVNAQTPNPARPGRVATALAARRGSYDQPSGGMVVLHPTGMSAVDLAADLSCAISMRMKPPPEPPADLHVSTGAWLILSLAAAALWAVGVVNEFDTFPLVYLVGSLLLAVGYLWAAYLAGQRDWVRGLVTLVPPVTAWRLFHPFGDNAYRPLRFVLTGLLFLTLGYLGPPARSAVRPVFAALRPTHTDPAAPAAGPVERLRAAVDRRQPDGLLVQLGDLAQPDAVKNTPAESKQELVIELKKLTKAERPEVRTAALNALVRWSPEEARGPTLDGVRSTDASERKNALALAARWHDAEAARAVAARLSDRMEQAQAQESLLGIGGPEAEAALLPLLKSDDDLFVLTVVDLLERIGGPQSVEALQGLSRVGSNGAIREEAGRRANALAARLNAPKK